MTDSSTTFENVHKLLVRYMRRMLGKYRPVDYADLNDNRIVGIVAVLMSLNEQFKEVDPRALGYLIIQKMLRYQAPPHGRVYVDNIVQTVYMDCRETLSNKTRNAITRSKFNRSESDRFLSTIESMVSKMVVNHAITQGRSIFPTMAIAVITMEDYQALIRYCNVQLLHRLREVDRGFFDDQITFALRVFNHLHDRRAPDQNTKKFDNYTSIPKTHSTDVFVALRSAIDFYIRDSIKEIENHG